ncbi:alpha-galactosidase [Austwickia chelonae]|uniref:Alpha-galactosidase n=1 Tax=Austwickia chelonae NBRC 105200 TaxID=1184607 RepID=K6W804_9MICO|nr:glycoside hydrolase family 27 protein [Austwickia chelonae]GAB77972.1 putative glycoside hydrolase [Austwickia chelonae NBRC 105200]SEV93373.1 alpha-galactosidase [Austwickia chelonae]
MSTPGKGTIAATPPMGWCTWNAFRTAIDETMVIAMADAMASTGLRDAGYRYLVIDDGWQAPRRDRHGRLASDPHRFPSGIPALVEETERRGLTLGIYASPGRQTCAMIYDQYTGEGLGSYGHEQQDMTQFADWGIGYLKYDWCEAHRSGTGLDYRSAFTRMRSVIDDLGWPGIYSISEYGRSNPWEWAPGTAHSWRTTPDILPTWESILGIAHNSRFIGRYAGPGGWNDLDMLQVGNGELTAAECRTHLTLWSLLASPLMAGNDLRTMPEWVSSVLTNPGVIAIDQDPAGRPGNRLLREDTHEIWTRPLARGRHAVAVIATGREPVHVTWDGTTLRTRDPHEMAIRLPVTGPLRDIWTGTAVEDRAVDPHDVLLAVPDQPSPDRGRSPAEHPAPAQPASPRGDER